MTKEKESKEKQEPEVLEGGTLKNKISNALKILHDRYIKGQPGREESLQEAREEVAREQEGVILIPMDLSRFLDEPIKDPYYIDEWTKKRILDNGRTFEDMLADDERKRKKKDD